MEKKTVVVTGSSSGFGFLTALAFARNGFQVIATMREVAKKEPLLQRAKESGCDENLCIAQLDITDAESIGRFVATLSRVDVLVNNAGFACAGFSEDVSDRELRSQFETNFFATAALTNALLPLMRRQGRGRIINVSSISGLVGFPGLSPYVASKHALEGWSESLRLETAPYGIDVCLVEPASYNTNIWSTGTRIAQKTQSLDSAYYDFYRRIERYSSDNRKSWGDPNDVAEKIIHIAKLKKTRLRYPIGKGIGLFILVKRILPWRCWQTLVLNTFK